MKYTVHYEGKLGMWELHSGTETVEVDSEEETVDKAYKLIERDFFDRPRSGWYFSVN